MTLQNILPHQNDTVFQVLLGQNDQTFFFDRGRMKKLKSNTAPE
jgi:hypothetical protein